jgi:hypothetical protein
VGEVRLQACGVLVLVAVGGLVGAAGPAAADTGPWEWPLEGEVTRDFAPPQTRYGAGHRGVDLAAAPGAVVRAAGAGSVTYAGMLAGRGVVVVRHGALRTTYEPVSAEVRVGAVVAAGAPLGRLEPGHLGCPGPACLHWGLRRGEEYLDPLALVGAGAVRLLPLGAGTGGADGEPLAGESADHGDAVAEPGREAPGPGAEEAAEGSRRAVVDLPAPAGRGDQPSWSLRAAEAPLGAAAVAALVLGIGLIARPRPSPHDPASGGVAAPAAPAVDEPPGPPGLLLDLDDARARRQAAS